MRRLVLSVALGAGVALLACTDSTGPEVSRTPAERAGPGFVLNGSPINIVHQSDEAAPLETYKQSVTACRGEAADLWFSYERTDQAWEDGVRDFLHLHIPADALSKYPDGRSFRDGDCVSIKAIADPEYLLAEFRPEGLTFKSSSRAQLTLWYTGASFDFDRDGDVDGADEAIRLADLDIWRLPHDSGDWTELDASHDAIRKVFSIGLSQFSHYAVAH